VDAVDVAGGLSCAVLPGELGRVSTRVAGVPGDAMAEPVLPAVSFGF
jgi:hypothetical protein